MRKHFALIAVALLVGACSPLAPSTSKFSNAQAQKATPTDNSAKINNAVLQSNTLGLGDAAFDSAPGQQTVYKTTANFKRDSASLSASMRTTMDLDVIALDDFMKTGSTTFQSTHSRVKENETDYSKRKLRILLIISADNAVAARKSYGDLSLALSWVAQQPSGEAIEPNFQPHWLLSFSHKGDPASDSQNEAAFENVRSHLVGISIEFQGT